MSSRAPEHVFTSQSAPLAPSPPLLRYCLFLSGCHSNREPPAKRVQERRGKKDRNVRERKRDGSEKRRGREGGRWRRKLLGVERRESVPNAFLRLFPGFPGASPGASHLFPPSIPPASSPTPHPTLCVLELRAN